MVLIMHNSFVFRLERLGLHGCALRGTVLVVVRSEGRKRRRIESDFARHSKRREAKQGALIGQQSDGKMPPTQTVRGADLLPDQLELLGLARLLRPAVRVARTVRLALPSAIAVMHGW